MKLTKMISLMVFLFQVFFGGAAVADANVAYDKLTGTSRKIESFLFKNESYMSSIFPEFQVSELLDVIPEARFEIVEKHVLKDGWRRERACLTHKDTGVIECGRTQLESVLNNPMALHALVFHQLLLLIGEEWGEYQAPERPEVIGDYPLSKRLAAFVSGSYGTLSLGSRKVIEGYPLNNKVFILEGRSGAWSKDVLVSSERFDRVQKENEELAKVGKTLRNALTKKGFHIVGNIDEARFVVTDYYNTCRTVHGDCLRAVGGVDILDKMAGKEKNFFGTNFSTEIGNFTVFPASKKNAFKEALSEIPVWKSARKRLLGSLPTRNQIDSI